MKKIFTFLVLIPLLLIGQTPTQTENYIRTKIYKIPTVTSIITPSIQQANQKVVYLDGFGRPKQQIVYQQSATGKNVVIPIEYNAKGLREKDYLPYSTQTNGLAYEASALTNVLTFYNTPYYDNTTNPYSEILYESSSLNRVLKKASPGNPWKMGAGNETNYEYLNNVSTDIVPIFTVSASANNLATLGYYSYSSTLTSQGFYQPNHLFKKVTKNENWTSGNNNTIEEFYNKEGQLILKRTFSVSVVGGLETNVAHDTYYVYDQYGNLTFMIPPLVDTTITITSAVLNELCYQYRYDERNRMVEKKLPGKQWEFIMYDNLDRVVATGPAFSPFTNFVAPNNLGWLITKYDVFNRPVLTAWLPATTVTSTDRMNLQNSLNGATNLSESKTATNVTLNGVIYRYTNVAWPTSTTHHILTLNYYDNYDSNLTFNPTIAFTPINGQNVYNNTAGTTPKGMPTMSWVRIPETSTLYKAEKNYILYDKKGREVRIFTNNYLGGYSQVDSQIEPITGRLNYTITIHKRSSQQGVATTTIRDDFAYSLQDRLLTHTHKINNLTTTQLLVKNEYDEMGRIVRKNVGGNDLTGTNTLQKVDLGYNIRGWLTKINDISNLTQGVDPQDLFAYKINYDIVDIAVSEDNSSYIDMSLYNGNISSIKWRTASDNVLRKYSYVYDGLNRLKNAIYQKPNDAIPLTNSYNESLTYDKNGNIKSLKRNGNIDAVFPTIEIDNLTYDYALNSNKLNKVTDNPITATSGFVDGANLAVEYTYDANGNMITDANKGITAIVYNHLNLPTKISFGTNTIQYLYNAQGEKVGKTVTQNGVSTVTDYLTGFQYKKVGAAAVALEFFPHSEGYVQADFKYVFQYNDQVGNVRLSYCDIDGNGSISNSEILEENHYYPFGLKHNGYNTNTNSTNSALNYMFQEQERQKELNLNWDSFKWRNYDYTIGRFMSVDPLTEKYNWMTPYQFASNQVIHAPEIEGLENYDDLNIDDLDFDNHPVFGANLFDNNGNQVFEPTFDLIEVVITVQKGVGDFETNDDDNDNNGDNDDDVDAIDLFDYGVGGLGESTGLMGRLWQGSSNSSQWRAAYQLSKITGVGASVIKNSVNPTLSKVGTGLALVSVGITTTKIISTQQVHASDVLALSMTALGATGFGAPIATAFFVADLISLAVTNKSLGDHLDKAVGEPLLDFSNGSN